MVVARLVYNRLPEITAALRPRASQIVRKTASDIEAHAKAVVPVDTGNLKNSIQTEMESDLTAVVSTGVEYAPYVEYGTHKMAPRPYLGSAAEAVKPAFEAAMKALFE
jgi:HK97 gp10 family phage protein